MKRIAITIILLLGLLGCRQVQDTTKIKYQYIDRHHVDTIHVHEIDSVLTEKKGDTVYIREKKIKKEYKRQLHTDTVILNDTIYIDKKNIESPAPQLSWWDNLLKDIGKRTIYIIIIIILFIFLRSKKI